MCGVLSWDSKEHLRRPWDYIFIILSHSLAFYTFILSWVVFCTVCTVEAANAKTERKYRWFSVGLESERIWKHLIWWHQFPLLLILENIIRFWKMYLSGLSFQHPIRLLAGTLFSEKTQHLPSANSGEVRWSMEPSKHLPP